MIINPTFGPIFIKHYLRATSTRSLSKIFLQNFSNFVIIITREVYFFDILHEFSYIYSAQF